MRSTYVEGGSHVNRILCWLWSTVFSDGEPVLQEAHLWILEAFNEKIGEPIANFEAAYI